jgi:DNA-binding transcriptional LysR family regulator
MDMNILKYMAFIKTVECGSFTKASDVLNYSQSGNSRMIGDLEKEWEVTLLERSRTGVKLTSDGTRLLPFATSVCAEYGKLQMQVDDLNGLQSGLIRIGTISSIATHWLPNIIAEFQKKYPNIDYELLLGHYRDIEEWIVEGRVDCGFLRVPTATSLETEYLATDKLLAVLPVNHPLAGYDKFPVAAFAEYPFMLLEKGDKADISEIFDRCHVKPKVHFTTVDDYAVMSMVENGLGISILPELILRRTPYHIITKELDVPAFRDLGIAVRNKGSVSLALSRFMEHLDFRETQ